MIKQAILLLSCIKFISTTGPSPYDCDFQSPDLCGWKSEAKWLWLRLMPSELQDKPGPKADHFGETEGYFMYASADDSEFAEATLISPLMNGSAEIRRCFMFFFMKEDEGGVTDLEVTIIDNNGWEDLVWKWEDGIMVQEWQHGQVELNQEITKKDYKIKVVARHGDTDTGFVAVDDFELYALPVGENCFLEPSTEAPPTTPPPGLQDCDFESGRCGWNNAGGSQEFQWKVTTPRIEAEAGHMTPEGDPNGNEDGHLMYVGAGSEIVEPGETTRFQTTMTAEAENKCMMFEYNIDRYGGISTLRILTKQEPEGPEQVVWEINKDTSLLPEDGGWPEPGQISINSHQVIVEAVQGDGQMGFAALDDILFWYLEECPIIPPEASPGTQTTTTAPGTTTGTDLVCFSPGVCVDSFLLDEIPSENANDCLAACQDHPSCHWFSFFPEIPACALFSNCEDLNVIECPTCLSGEKNCKEQLYCDVQGQCQGTFLHGEQTNSSNSCLLACHERPSCQWFTWDSRDEACFLFKDCVISLNDSCETCVSGQKDCHVQDCSKGCWHNSQFGCFKLFTEQVSWSNAESSCQTHGGHLASIHSQEENDILKGLHSESTAAIWLGGSDQGSEGTWTWTDGSAWDYSYWAIGPNECGSACDWLCYSNSPSYNQFKWYDSPSYVREYVCKI